MKRSNPILLTSFLVFLTLFILNCSKAHPLPEIPKTQYVVMLSLDGCRWDYPQLADMPHLESIARRGVKMESLQPSFPTKTFPNHYSMATGLYPDHHGIINNTFYDAGMDAYFKLSDRKAVQNPDFYSGEPIWVSAEKQGLKTASYFWVGSETAISGTAPSIWKEYRESTPFEARIDSVIAWLQLPENKRPRLITWYFHEPDGVGHRFGPESEEVKTELRYLDGLIGDFLDKLEKLPIASQVNVIVTSDHGMSRISGDKVIYLDDYIQSAWLDTALGSNPVWNLDVKEGFMDSVMTHLKGVPKMQFWQRDSLPDTLHYGSHPRVMDIVCSASQNWSLLWRSQAMEPGFVGGTHGFDPRFKEMHAIFFAAGPAFKTGYIHPTVENVNLYPLLARILNISPAATDGKLENVSRMLKPAFLDRH